MKDRTYSLWKEPYTYFTKRRRATGRDVFVERLLLRNTYCLVGREAAQLFYDASRFTREGAMPSRMKRTLFRDGGIQLLDGQDHRDRKQLLMSFMTRSSVESLRQGFYHGWLGRIPAWSREDRVLLFPELQRILLQAVTAWVGIPANQIALSRRAAEFAELIDGAGAVGPRYWKSVRARKSLEQWLRVIVSEVRRGRATVGDESILAQMAHFRYSDGRKMSEQEVVVDLMNLIRPTVAVARFMVFSALAVHDHPEWQPELEANEGARERFVQEVRRFFPFFPFVLAKVRHDFNWQGVHFSRGSRALLDLYGTNHDERFWKDPDDFWPDRFVGWESDAYALIPQGGGDFVKNHRCAGEWITISLMKTAVDLLAEEMDYYVPEQDLSMDMSRVPPLPRSRFVIAQVSPHAKTELGRGIRAR